MHQGFALTAIYLTVLAVFVGLIPGLFGISLTLVIVGFVVFSFSLLPSESELSSADSDSATESPSDTPNRWW